MIEIEEQDLLDLIHFARRYVDKRTTYAPSVFNTIYKTIMIRYPDLQQKDPHDKTLKENGKFFPYAQDGMYK